MKTIYWASTSLIALAALASAMSYLFSQSTIEGIRALGFPDFFRIQLAVLKIAAAIILIAPAIPLRVREWAYVGLFLFIFTAIVAHAAHKDAFGLHLINLTLLAILIASNVSLHALSTTAS